MTVVSDPFIEHIRELCKNDPIMNGLIHHTISWADVPSDDEPLELEGWRSYQAVQQRATSAYRRTVRHERKAQLHRATVKHAPPMERKPYVILKQEYTKKVLLPNGRVSPVKEVVEVVYQEPVEYEEVDIEKMVLTEPPLEYRVEKPIEMSVVLTEEPVKEPADKEEAPVLENTPSKPQMTQRHSKGKLNKKVKSMPSLFVYEPTFSELYLIPCVPYAMIILLLVMICSMKL